MAYSRWPRFTRITLVAALCPASLELDLDKEGRIHQRGHEDERRCWADRAKDLAVGRRHGGHVPMANDEHPRPNDISKKETSLVKGRRSDLENRPGLRTGVAGMGRSAIGSRIGRACDPARLAHRDRPAVTD
jgi:hypothetical protein